MRLGDIRQLRIMSDDTPGGSNHRWATFAATLSPKLLDRLLSGTLSVLRMIQTRKMNVSLALIESYEPFSLLLDAAELKMNLIGAGADDHLSVIHGLGI